MAPPEAEWMLWAKRLRDENKVLLQRIDSKPESSALEQLREEVRSLAATIEDLQRDNHALREKLQTLEPDALDRERAMGEQIHGLGRTVAELKKELSLTVEVVETMMEGGLASYQQQVRKPSSRPQQRAAAAAAAAKMTYRTRAGEVPPLSQNPLNSEMLVLAYI